MAAAAIERIPNVFQRWTIGLPLAVITPNNHLERRNCLYLAILLLILLLPIHCYPITQQLSRLRSRGFN